MSRLRFQLVLCAVLAPSVSLAAPNRELEELSVPGVHWQRAEPASLQGVALTYRGFRSDQSPVQVAAAFSADYPQFRQVLSVAGHLLLSGMRDGAHWLAHIEPGPKGASGTVSVLQVPQGTDAAVPFLTNASGPPAWLPAGSRTVFDHVGGRSGAWRQRVFRVADDATSLSAYLRKALRVRGWSPIQPGSDAGGVGIWQRRQALMHVSLRSAGRDSSLLYVQEQQ